MAQAERVADRLHSAAIHLLRWVRAVDAASGLSAPRLSALSVVVFGGPLTLGRLAEAEGVTPPTMTRLVDGLEDAGLVVRGNDPSDGRVTAIRATAKGTRLLMNARAERVAALTARVEMLKDEDQELLERAAAVIERLATSASPAAGTARTPGSG